MKSSNQDRVSPLTKVIVDKVHGGRKVDSKFWQSEFDNSGNDSVSIPIEKPEDLDSFLKNLKARRTLLFAGVMVLCLLYSMVYFRPDLFPFLSYSKIYSTISEYFPDKKKVNNNARPITKSQPVVRSNGESSSNQDYTFSKDQVEKAKRELIDLSKSKQLRQKNNYRGTYVNSKNKPTNEHIKAVNSLYEIELLTGGRFTTKNVKITGDEVTFVSDRGLVVTIKKQDVKTLTRL